MTLGGLAFPIVQGVFTGNERIASGRVDVELFSPVSFWRRALITLEVLPLVRTHDAQRTIHDPPSTIHDARCTMHDARFR